MRIREAANGSVEMRHLEQELQRHTTPSPDGRSPGTELIGCFSAASNITGVITDADAVTILLHKYGALAFWDYATAGEAPSIGSQEV